MSAGGPEPKLLADNQTGRVKRDSAKFARSLASARGHRAPTISEVERAKRAQGDAGPSEASASQPIAPGRVPPVPDDTRATDPAPQRAVVMQSAAG